MNSKKRTFLISLGAGLEYYDFVIYGLLVSYLGKAFFSAQASLYSSLSVFAVGYLARPLGGLLFAHYGDRLGRRKIFLLALWVMAIATLGIGFLPTAAQWGIAAPVCLFLLRILQGIAFGAELPGTFTFLIEHAAKPYRGRHCGFTIASISLGGALGSALILLLTKCLTAEQMAGFGWRIPFWVGGLLAVLSYWIRKQLEETPIFLHHQSRKQPFSSVPLFALFRQQGKAVILGIMLCLFPACFILFALSMSAYLQQFYGYSPTEIYACLLASLIYAAFILPLIGWLSDKVGRTRLLAATTMIVILSLFFLFKLLALKHVYALLAFVLLYQTIISFLSICYLPLLTELFPTEVRFTGVAFCYNLVYSIASFAPMIVTRLASDVNGGYGPYLFFAMLAVLTLCVTIIFMKNPILVDIDPEKKQLELKKI